MDSAAVSITVESARAAYANALKDRVTVRRYHGAGAGKTRFDAEDVPARVAGYAPEEIAGSIQQGDQRVILDAAALEARQWPAPPRTGDRIIIGNQDTTVQFCDPNTRKIGQTIIAYECQCRGQTLSVLP